MNKTPRELRAEWQAWRRANGLSCDDRGAEIDASADPIVEHKASADYARMRRRLDALAAFFGAES